MTVASADIDCVVLGAGVVGLAIARKLALMGRDVIIIDAGPGIGTGISSRNSEVIHAGIYYQPGSLKARLCVQGKQLLYDYCTERAIPHKQLGKLLVATSPEQVPKLDQLRQQASLCGVHDLIPITGKEARQLEPELHCLAALLSPSTGIVDSHALMLSLQGDAEHHGANCIFHTPFIQGQRHDNGLFSLEFGGEQASTLSAKSVINATGLSAPEVARAIRGLLTDTIPSSYYCKGSYFGLSGVATPFSRLIYPMPDHAGLGIHLTLDLGGRAKFGPDTEWVDSEDYHLDPRRADQFYTAIRQYWPQLPDHALSPDYTGIRPKIVPAGQRAADFVLAGPATHGIPQLINLFGIESPGLTSCLAIADAVSQTLSQAA